MKDETKKDQPKVTLEEARAIAEKTRQELASYNDHIEGVLSMLEAFLPKDMRVTIIVRKNDVEHEANFTGAMLRTNDDIRKLFMALAPVAKATVQNPSVFP